MGMIFGLILARQHDVKDPLMPALVSGILPMPMGIIAALLLTERQAETSTSSGTSTSPTPIGVDELKRLLAQYAKEKTANPPDPIRLDAVAQQLLTTLAAAPESERRKLPDAEVTKMQSFLQDLGARFRPRPS
jgi:hypothetical protein